VYDSYEGAGTHSGGYLQELGFAHGGHVRKNYNVRPQRNGLKPVGSGRVRTPEDEFLSKSEIYRKTVSKYIFEKYINAVLTVHAQNTAGCSLSITVALTHRRFVLDGKALMENFLKFIKSDQHSWVNLFQVKPRDCVFLAKQPFVCQQTKRDVDLRTKRCWATQRDFASPDCIRT